MWRKLWNNKRWMNFLIQTWGRGRRSNWDFSFDSLWYFDYKSTRILGGEQKLVEIGREIYIWDIEIFSCYYCTASWPAVYNSQRLFILFSMMVFSFNVNYCAMPLSVKKVILYVLIFYKAKPTVSAVVPKHQSSKRAVQVYNKTSFQHLNKRLYCCWVYVSKSKALLNNNIETALTVKGL